jgi:homoaconitate hydratase family protein
MAKSVIKNNTIEQSLDKGFPMTFAQKVLAINGGLKKCVPGQVVTVTPSHLLTHDNTSAIIGKIKEELDEHGVCNPDLSVIVIDHVAPACSEKNAVGHKAIRDFVKKFDVKNFFDVGQGICHQIVLEKGLALPGKILVGSDSHTCSYGAVNAFSTGIDRTEAAALLLTGRTWLKVPSSIKVNIKGSFKNNASAKDLILTIIGDIGAGGATYKSVEFHGDLLSLNMDDRITIANMGIEMGAKTCVFPFDAITQAYFDQIGTSAKIAEQGRSFEPVWADENAVYESVLNYDLSKIVPVAACPHKVDNVKNVSDLNDINVNQALIGTCTNGRVSDFRIAARVFENSKVHPDVRLLLLPASKSILSECMKKGYIQTLVDAGAVLLPPGCGPCLGAHQGVLAPGEKCISTANRNFKGRMGCKDGEIYLASPYTVACSAVSGFITDRVSHSDNKSDRG